MTVTFTVEIDVPDEIELELEAMDAVESHLRGLGWRIKPEEETDR